LDIDSHVRVEAKRKALEAIAENTGTVGYDTVRDANSQDLGIRLS